MGRHKAWSEILRSDPERDHQRIVNLSAAHELPFDMTRALEFSLFRTFAVPSIGALLDQAVLRAMAARALRARSLVVRQLPERKRPRLRSEMRHRTYPRGWRTEALGLPPADAPGRRENST